MYTYSLGSVHINTGANIHPKGKPRKAFELCTATSKGNPPLTELIGPIYIPL